MINNKKDKCLVCESKNLKNFITGYNKFWPRYFKRAAICEDCGHIQLNPLYKSKEYDSINSNFFTQNYLIDGKLNKENNDRKLKKINDFIFDKLSQDIKVLDVGAGEAWALPYFIEHCGNYSAIEEVPQLRSAIESSGGDVIANSLNSDLTKFEGEFDIIIFRHTLEHLLNPKKHLKVLRDLLSDKGFIFLALPNCGRPGTKKGFRTSFLRPVHISYFCEGNCERIVNLCGLKIDKKKINGEIQYLLSKSSFSSSNLTYENFYNSQISIFKKTARKTLVKDLTYILRDLIRIFIKRK